MRAADLAAGRAGRRGAGDQGQLLPDRLVQPGDLVGGQRDVRRGDVRLQVLDAPRARDRHDVVTLGEQPGERDLRRRLPELGAELLVGLDLGSESAPDETTVCKFRHLLERHGLGKKLFKAVNRHLQHQGLKGSSGTIVDATIIGAPSSTKNQDGKRDPEMCQTKKGNQYYFGMKAHVGVDSKLKIIHTAVATAANVADATVLPALLHGEETRVWGDQAYRGQTEVIRESAPRAQDCTQRRYRYKDRVDEVERAKNRTKSKVRSKVEHVFGVMKLKFGFVKVRYRGLKKNANRLFATCALVNLFIVRKKLLRLAVA